MKRSYTDVKAGLREGINFYTTLQEYLQKFKSKCSDFILARETEKNELLQQLSQPPPQVQQQPQQRPPQPQPPQGYNQWQPSIFCCCCWFVIISF